MADTVTTRTIVNSPKVVVLRLMNTSDGTGETNVTKMNIASFTNAFGKTATYTTIDRIEYSVWGMTSVQLNWDHTVDDRIANLNGNDFGFMDWCKEGGHTDPRSAGGTGNIILSTQGATATGGYDITLWVRPKA